MCLRNTNGIQIFYTICSYILKDVKRGSVATKREDFYIFIILKSALLDPQEPKSVMQSLVSICYTFCCVHFFKFSGGTTPPPPPTKIEGGVSRCLETFVVMIIIHYTTLKYSLRTLLRCVTSQDGHDLHKQTMSHDISHIFSA